MPPTNTQSAASTRGGKASTIFMLCAILILHYVLFVFEADYQTTHVFYLHTLLLFTLPILLGSFPNLKQYHRWSLYYSIWFQLMVETWAVEYISCISFDMFIFANMEGVFQKHLKATIDGWPIPRSIYFSSWISNTKLKSYIAAHRSEENVNDNEDISDKKQPSPTTSATTTTATSRSTTTATTKIKLGYLLATTVLLITVYQDFKTKYREYVCQGNLDTFSSFDPTANYFISNPNYCMPTLSTFEWIVFQHLPFLRCYSLRKSFLRLSALYFALAWSTIPTAVVISAWQQMWHGPSSSHRIKKVHYLVFMYPLKMAALLLVMYLTSDRQEDVRGAEYSGSSLDGVRAKYLLVWFVIFRAAAKLAFGLGLIWNLYVAHSKDATAGNIHHSLQEEKEKEREQV
ncbi:hypothetical protein BGZ91_011378 [Linnemannia elongata]|nr:hypothetical protein BGZ91_011378 [Linnemannia elongata]